MQGSSSQPDALGPSSYPRCYAFLGLALLIAATPGWAGSSTGVSLEVRPGVLLVKEGGRSLPVSLKCPRFVFDGVAAGENAAATATPLDINRGQPVSVTFNTIPLGESGKLEVVLSLDWSAKENVLRKWARFRVSNLEKPMLLEEVVLEDLDLAGRKVEAEPSDIQSYPSFTEGFFLGIEFPVALTRLENAHLILGQRPGLRAQPGIWYETHKAVYGVAEVGREKQAFEQYIMAHRPGPKGIHVNYNSWWTSPAPYYTEGDILGLMKTFEEKLYKPYKVSFDTFCIDMGWSDPKSIWEIDKKLFPDGFSRIEQAAARAGSRLGLWISPSSQYPTALDNDWAEKNGYETFGGDWRYACLGGKRYREAFRDHLIELINRYGIRHVKFDGYQFVCSASNHGHAPGALSAEACAEGIIEVFESVRKVAPDLWMEPTCFGWHPSPWWLFYTNSVIGTFGDDAPTGRVPCPIYRESYTTARDYFNLQGAYWMCVPIAGQEVLGIVHQSDEPLMNDAVMTLMRGHMFLPIYLNPKYMNVSRWKWLAQFLTWARKNAPALEQTEPLLPASWLNGKCPKITRDDPMPREPYGYAHWKGTSALVALRNPWIAPGTYPLRLKDIAAGSTAVSLYPEVRTYGRNLKSGDTLQVPLAPYETLALSISRQAASGVLPAPDAAVSLRANALRREVTKVVFDGPRQQFGPDWTSKVGEADAALELLADADVTVGTAHTELLVLREGNDPGVRPLCHVKINGKEVADTSSDCSENGWSAGVRSPEQWLFLHFPLAKGENRIHVELSGNSESDRLSAWVWATKPGAKVAVSYPNVLPQPELIPLGAVCLGDTGGATPKVVHRPRPVDRINGVFLDALDPTSVQIGWGKLQKNKSINGDLIRIGSTRYLRGLGDHAPSKIVYALDGKYRRFQAWVGPDAGAGTQGLIFEVHIDGQKKWDSALMKKGAAAKRIDIDITGAKTLELVTDPAGDGTSDWADWGDPKVLR